MKLSELPCFSIELPVPHMMGYRREENFLPDPTSTVVKFYLIGGWDTPPEVVENCRITIEANECGNSRVVKVKGYLEGMFTTYRISVEKRKINDFLPGVLSEYVEIVSSAIRNGRLIFKFPDGGSTEWYSGDHHSPVCDITNEDGDVCTCGLKEHRIVGDLNG